MDVRRDIMYVKPGNPFANREHGYIAGISKIDYDDETVYDDNGKAYSLGEVVLLRDTVLYDKEERPIHEGNLVKFKYNVWGTLVEYTGKVRYCKEGRYAGSFVVDFFKDYDYCKPLGVIMEVSEIEQVGFPEPFPIKEYEEY